MALEKWITNNSKHPLQNSQIDPFTMTGPGEIPVCAVLAHNIHCLGLLLMVRVRTLSVVFQGATLL